MRRALFVMGTEPKAGCTTVSCALAAALRERGQAIGVLKPVAVGCGLDPDARGAIVGGMPGTLDPPSLAALSRLMDIAGPLPATLSGPTSSDALLSAEAQRLLVAAGAEEPIDTVNPYRFAPDLEPAAAARAANVEIELDRISRCFDQIATRRDLVVVDGGVGPLVPLNRGQTLVDLVMALGAPVILVAPSRPWAAINATLLAIEVLGARGATLAGVVLNRRDQTFRPEEAANPFHIEEHAGAVVRGLLPFLDPEQLAVGVLAGRFETHVDLDGILAALA